MSTQPIELAVVVPPIASTRPTYLMCPPKLYDVNYVINPWMAGNITPPPASVQHSSGRICTKQ